MIIGNQRAGLRTWPAFIIFAMLWSWPQFTWSAAPAGAETEELMELSLEELLQVTVTSVSRKPQPLSNTPAAIFVISQSDIQRSGAKTIPDVLRMVPGIEVAQLDASTWAVSSRGSNGVFANRLLVLMDGRTLYSPMFSGVYWEIQDTDLSSIDRIEVIRGPGGTMWGANALNGVINIITKHAKDTQGTSVEVGAGTNTKIESTVRSGGESRSGNAQFRAFAKYFHRKGFADDNYDDWGLSRIGGRLDWSDQVNDRVTLTGELYSGDVGENILINMPAPPFSTSTNVDRGFVGGFALLTWNKSMSETSDIQFRTYYDRNSIDNVSPEETRDTLDFDFQHHFVLGTRHDFVWGLGYRFSEDDTNGTFTVSLDPAARTQRLLNAFIQDEIRLSDTLYLTFGTKVEKNNFSPDNLEWSPNVRLTWQDTEKTTVWASVARAIRSASRMELDGVITGVVLPPGVPIDPMAPPFPLPTALTINGNPLLASEDVISYDIGFRTQPFEAVTFDLALFFNQYKELPAGVLLPAVCQPSGVPAVLPLDPICFAGTTPYVEFPLTFVNSQEQDNYGAELAVSYMATDWWRLDGAYTYLHLGEQDVLPFSVGQDSPEHQLSIRSAMDMNQTTSFDLWLRFVDELESQGVDAYTTVDAKLSYMPVPSVRLSLVGRNLLDAGHVEFVEEFGINRGTEVPREGYIEFQWRF